MNSYELMYILDCTLEEDGVNSLCEKFSTLITNLGGSITEEKKLGKKKFAYEINFKSEGYYVLTEFSIEGDKIAEIERQLRITDGVVRHMVIRK